MIIKITVFWEVRPCSLVDMYFNFGGMCHEAGGRKFLLNVGNDLLEYTASHPTVPAMRTWAVLHKLQQTRSYPRTTQNNLEFDKFVLSYIYILCHIWKIIHSI
jgi:hypothetical protein